MSGNLKRAIFISSGSNLPHTFQKRVPELVTSAVVVQFRERISGGSSVLQLPESRHIKQLLEVSSRGLKIRGI